MCDKMGANIKRFQKLIDNSGKTRPTIAKELGCDTSTITKHYNGDRGITTDYLIKYAKYFNVSADYLNGGIDEPAPNTSHLKNLPVPHNSVAEEWYLKGEQYEANDIQKIDLNVWFNLRESENNNWGYEYCLVSSKYNTVLSVVWED